MGRKFLCHCYRSPIRAEFQFGWKFRILIFIFRWFHDSRIIPLWWNFYINNAASSRPWITMTNTAKILFGSSELLSVAAKWIESNWSGEMCWLRSTSRCRRESNRSRLSPDIDQPIRSSGLSSLKVLSSIKSTDGNTMKNSKYHYCRLQSSVLIQEVHPFLDT